MDPGGAGSHYIHGTHTEEQQRLSLLNELLNQAALREMALRGGEKILDVGSGLGQFTRAMAEIAGPDGLVIGIERSTEQIAAAQHYSGQGSTSSAPLEFRQGDATALPLRESEWGTFDLAHTRFLLEHVSDPLEVVRMMAQSLRPGGRLILEDDDHDVLRIWPEVPYFYNAWKAYILTYYKFKNDPYIGRKLVSLLQKAGAQPTKNAWLFFGSCAGNELFPYYIENLIGVVYGARQTVLSAGLIQEEDFDRGMDEIHQWKQRPDGALWYAVCWAEGTK